MYLGDLEVENSESILYFFLFVNTNYPKIAFKLDRCIKQTCFIVHYKFSVLLARMGKQVKSKFDRIGSRCVRSLKEIMCNNEHTDDDLNERERGSWHQSSKCKFSPRVVHISLHLSTISSPSLNLSVYLYLC